MITIYDCYNSLWSLVNQLLFRWIKQPAELQRLEYNALCGVLRGLESAVTLTGRHAASSNVM